MQVISDTLTILVDSWDDPGDYPSNAGSGPLPSYDYIAGIEGELTVKLSFEELRGFCHAVACDELNDFVEQDIDPKLPAGILKVNSWEHELRGPILKLWSEDEVEEDPNHDWGEDQEPDDFDDKRWAKAHGEEWP